MTKQNALIIAERVGDGLELEFQGKRSDIFAMYKAITSQIFCSFVHAVKGEDKKEIASNSVSALIHTLLCGVGMAFEECDELDKELKPFVKDAIKEVIKGFEVDIDVYFADEDDRKTCKKVVEKTLDDLHNEAEEAAKKGDIDSLIDVLSTLAAIASAVRNSNEERAK